jgi:inner membrane transporter RhtA
MCGAAGPPCWARRVLDAPNEATGRTKTAQPDSSQAHEAPAECAVYGPVGTGALRFAVAAPILLLVARPALHGRSPRFWRSAIALGVSLAGLNLALYGAIERAPLGTVMTVQYLGPLMLAVAGMRRRLDVLWVAAAAGGIGLVTGGPAGGSTAGLLLALSAAVLTMISLVLSRRLATESAGVDGLAVAVAAAAFVTLPAAGPAALATRTTDDLARIAAVALLGLAVPFGLEYIALRAVSVRTFGVLLSLDPAIAAVAGAVCLRQRLGAADVAGIGLVVVASAGAMGDRGMNERK